jgi:parallel beta-helix repeat protein
MRRKVVQSTVMTAIVILSAGMAGGQVPTGLGASPQFLGAGNHEPIYIYGDCDFTAANGVVGGTGTCADPYIIEGWRIDGPRADYGIYVDHTRACFVIRDCTIESSRIAGVYMNSVRNGVVEDVDIRLSDAGIYLLNSDYNVVRDCSIRDCKIGVEMAAFSDRNVVSRNSFIDNGLHALDPMRGNSWCDGGRGNYWSDFVGCDRNGDGIFDAPNYRYGDPCPLVEPPPEPTPVTPSPEPTPELEPELSIEEEVPSETPVVEEPIQTASETPGSEEVQTPSGAVEEIQTPSVTMDEGETETRTPPATLDVGETQTGSVTGEVESEETQTPSDTAGTPTVDVQTPPAVPEPVVDEPEESDDVQSPSESTT